MFFEVASSFLGISEIKNALKGGNLTLVVSETLKKIPKDAIKIVTSTPKITSKTAKEIVQEVKNGLGKVDGKQIIFKSDFIKHLSEVVNFSQKKGVTGGHNLQKFEKYLIDNNIEINRISIVKGPIDGIIELTYQIKKTDSSGWKTQIFKKTLYDSKKISDTDMIKYGKEAIEEGIKNNRIKYQLGSNNIITGKSSNGIIFNGYQNPQTGEIINFHPIIE